MTVTFGSVELFVVHKLLAALSLRDFFRVQSKLKIMKSEKKTVVYVSYATDVEAPKTTMKWASFRCEPKYSLSDER